MPDPKSITRKALYDHGVPHHDHDGLIRWIHDHIPPGGFLQAVLCDQLSEAFARADNTNAISMHRIVSYLYADAPSMCWRSPKNVWHWCAPEMRDRLIDPWAS